jgi:heat shock 70kDa protein 1/2/6/8
MQGTNNFVVFDLGGGTFDVSVLKIQDGSTFDVLAVAGDTHLGGVDFDKMLAKHLVEEFNKIHKITLEDRAIARIQEACEQAKITLSQSQEATINLVCIQNGLDFSLVIERGKFELMCGELFDKTLECVKSALVDAKLEPNQIDEILLVGGSTRIPKIRALLMDCFEGKKLNSAIHSDEAVAYGAAIQAAISSGAFCNSFGKLNDVTPLSLGILSNAANLLNLMSTIVRRNTKIPHKATERYETRHDFQTEMEIAVYEGERRFAADNFFLSKFTLHNLTSAKKGETKVDVQFELDENGILTVTANEVGNANTSSIKIDNITGRLSKETIEKMKQDAKKWRDFDDERAFRLAMRNQLNNYITDCFEKLDKTENIQDNVIEEVATKCAKEYNWLKTNQQASNSEIHYHFASLKAFVDSKLNLKPPKSRLSKIYGLFNTALQIKDEENAP